MLVEDHRSVLHFERFSRAVAHQCVAVVHRIVILLIHEVQNRGLLELHLLSRMLAFEFGHQRLLFLSLELRTLHTRQSILLKSAN